MNEKISALIDDELDEASAALLFEQLRQDEGLRRQWDMYHMIGDVLRHDAPAVPNGAVLTKVMAEIEREPEILAAPKPEKTSSPVWMIAASVMGVVLVGWLAAALLMESPADVEFVPKTIVSIPGGVAPEGIQPVAHAQLSIDDELFEYMMNHQSMRGALVPDAVQYSRAVSRWMQE